MLRMMRADLELPQYCYVIFQEYVTLGQFCDFLLEPPLTYQECAEVQQCCI